MALRICHAACSPALTPETFDCSTWVVAYPGLWPVGVSDVFQPMSAITISLACVVDEVGPTDGAVLLPDFVAVWSRGAAAAPATSITVKATAELALTVAVTLVSLMALAAYQTSPSLKPL